MERWTLPSSGRKREAIRPPLRGEGGQSIIELIFLLPFYMILAYLVVQLTATYFLTFDDLADLRNEALKAARKAESTRPACFEVRREHTFLTSLTGQTTSGETRLRLWAYADGPRECPP